jgi:hypothetical protein
MENSALDTTLISPDRPALLKLTDGEVQQDVDRDKSPFNDSAMDVDVVGAWTERQETPGTGANAANPFDAQAPDLRLPRQLDDSLSRPIRQHRSRTAPFRNRVYNYRRGDFYSPRNPVYYDHDAFCANSTRISSQQREDSPETLEEKARAVLVATMADADIREERDDRREDRRDDRRDRGNYRGNNKRRRDGECTHYLTSIAQAAWAGWVAH